MPAWSFPCPRPCPWQHVPARRLLSCLLQSPVTAASPCLQEPGTSCVSVPLCQGAAFALRRVFSPSQSPHRAGTLLTRCHCQGARSKVCALKARHYLEAETGTLGPGDVSKPENTSHRRCLHKAPIPAGFPHSPGQAHTVPGPRDQPRAANPITLSLAPPRGIFPLALSHLLPAGCHGGVQYPAPAAPHLVSW